MTVSMETALELPSTNACVPLAGQVWTVTQTAAVTTTAHASTAQGTVINVNTGQWECTAKNVGLAHMGMLLL